MDLPAPVSPVRSQGRRDISADSITAIFFIVEAIQHVHVSLRNGFLPVVYSISRISWQKVSAQALSFMTTKTVFSPASVPTMPLTSM